MSWNDAYNTASFAKQRILRHISPESIGSCSHVRLCWINHPGWSRWPLLDVVERISGSCQPVSCVLYQWKLITPPTPSIFDYSNATCHLVGIKYNPIEDCRKPHYYSESRSIMFQRTWAKATAYAQPAWVNKRPNAQLWLRDTALQIR